MSPIRINEKGINEKGAALVEASIALLLVFGMFFAIFQAALVGRAMHASRYGAVGGAREGSIAANNLTADYDILRAVTKAAHATSKDHIARVIVFRASGPESPVPAQCKSGAVAGLCNVYSSMDLSRTIDEFGIGGWNGDDAWQASSRRVQRLTGTDYIGVYIEVETGVNWLENLSFIESTAIVKLESTETGRLTPV